MQKETGTNEQTNTDILDPLQTLLKGTETKYEMKTKRVLINKERKQIQKRRGRSDPRIRQKSSSISTAIPNREYTMEL